MARFLRNDGDGREQWLALGLVYLARGRYFRVASQLLLIGFVATLSFAQSKENRSMNTAGPSPGQVSGHLSHYMSQCRGSKAIANADTFCVC